MGDVQLPLKLSTSYYIGVSTSNLGEDTSQTSNATLFTFTKPTFRFFRLRNSTKNKKSLGTKDGNPKKVTVSLHWPFFSVVESQGLETGSPSSSKDTLSSSRISVNNKGDGIESLASHKSPLEKSSTVSSVSPSSVLGQKLFIEKEGDRNENGFESSVSCKDAPKLSYAVEGEKDVGWDASKSFAKYDHQHQLSRSTPCNVVEQGGASFVDGGDEYIELDPALGWDTSKSFAKYDHQLSRSAPCNVGASFVKDINDDGDEYIELELSKSESCSIYGDPLTSLRRSSGSDILKLEAGNMIENNSSEISDEEIHQWDDFCSSEGHDANPGKASEVAPNLAESKKTLACKGDNPFLVVKLFERFSVFSPLGLFMGRMIRAIDFLRGSYSAIFWMNLKKRIVLLAASQINLKTKQVVKNRISGGGGEVELWKKNIPMGRRCRVLELEDYSCGNGEKLAAAAAAAAAAKDDAADACMNSRGDGMMAEGSSLRELMEMAAEAPVFNWNPKEARSLH